jgi:hypothetical protein
LVFVIKRGETKENFYIKKEEEMWHLILIARNNHFVFHDIRKNVYGREALARKL